MRFPDPLRPARQLVADLTHAGRRQRRASVANGRAHVEVRGANKPGSESFLKAVEERLEALDGVDWAAVNAMAGRVAIAFDGDAVDVDDLIEVIEGVEEAHGLHRQRFPADRPEHPGDREPLVRNALALGADVVGLGLSGFGLLLRLSPLPVEVASVVTLVDSTPRLRRVLENQLGPAADLGLALTNALAQGLAQGPLGLVVDIAHRAGLAAEASARIRIWESREPELIAQWPGAPAVEIAPRPRALPAGPVERYADRASLASLGLFGVAWATTADPRRAANVFLAGLPKAARLGREAFAAQLGRLLCGTGAVVMDPGALRRLDRLDTAVLDSTVLTSGSFLLGEVVALGAVARPQLQRQAHALFDPQDVQGVQRQGKWSLGPLGALGVRVPPGLNSVIDPIRPGTHTVVGLCRDGVLVGAVAVLAELEALAEALVEAARRSGLSVLVAGTRGAVAAQLGADGSVAGGNRLAAAVRELQAEGRAVAVVSDRHRAALLAADCGIGVLRAAAPCPWGADVLVGPGLGGAWAILGACGAARQVSRTSATLAMAGSGLGGVLAILAPPPAAGRQALLAVNSAALAAVARGAWVAVRLPLEPPAAPASRVPWHTMDAADVLARLGSTPRGLSAREAVARRRQRVARDAEAVSLLRAVREELANPLTPLLAGGAIVSAAVGAITDATLVGGVTALNAVVGAAQRVRTEGALERLVDLSSSQATVTRDGSRASVPVDDVVAGDVVWLEAGDVVPADCRILEADGLEVDESSLTGESLPAPKSSQACPAVAVGDQHCMLFDDTIVAAGTAVAVAVATGEDTEAGRALVGTGSPPATGVETRLNAITALTVPLTLLSGAAVTGLGFLRGRSPRAALSAGVSLTVAAVPEGLPLLATVAQLAAARRLSARGALVRNPRTIEALGRVDVLCFDKTGTLTEGRIGLQGVSDGVVDEDLANLSERARVVLAGALRGTPAPRSGEVLPHATDQAILDGAEQLGVERDDGATGWRQVEEIPFEAARGFHAVVGAVGDAHRFCIKGAPEVVVARCDTWRRGDSLEPLMASDRRRLEATVERLARRGLRILAVAERSIGSAPELGDDDVEGLEFLGFVALADQIRASAAAAVAGVRRAGVAVVMITGDHPSTAAAIATELDILNGGRVVTGAELDELDDHELDAVVGAVHVFARVTPAHKVRIVESLRRSGRIVAMTGDGANDAPAIRLAHVGIALGRRGGAAAREAADLVVTDDRLETIIDAIIEGRAMWVSVRHALAILVGGNIGEVAFILFGTALTGTAPLSPRQLLLVNLFTDLVPAMAIALRPPPNISAEALLHEGPEASLGAALNRDIALRAATTAAGAGAAWTIGRLTGGPRRARTIGLVALVGTQLGQTMVAGGNSRVVIGSSVASGLALAGVVQTPIVSQFFGCMPLDPLAWAIVLGSSLLATVSSVVVPSLVGRVVSIHPDAHPMAIATELPVSHDNVVPILRRPATGRR